MLAQEKEMMMVSSLSHSEPAHRSSTAAHRQQVRRLPLVTARVDLAGLGIDLTPEDLIADLDPGFLPVGESQRMEGLTQTPSEKHVI